MLAMSLAVAAPWIVAFRAQVSAGQLNWLGWPSVAETEHHLEQWGVVWLADAVLAFAWAMPGSIVSLFVAAAVLPRTTEGKDQSRRLVACRRLCLSHAGICWLYVIIWVTVFLDWPTH